MRHVVSSLVLLSLAGLAPAGAQEERSLQTVTVTASRIDADDLRTAPAIYRRIPADFVLVEAHFQSGSRDPAARKRELDTMFGRLKKSVSDSPGYDLFGGVIGESSAPIDTVQFDDIYTDYSGQGRFTLTLSVDTKPGETFDLLMRRAATFLSKVKTEGRAEAYLGDEQYLGARGTDKHRADLIAAITRDVMDLRTAFQPAVVTVAGLESRVVTQPAGPLELEIFIPYTLTVESGAANSSN
ncbi:hypothetical protein [Hyphomonas johnsonii]|uniref:TonB-dependent receptor n=1 Tax=Hyphomonas johnsonii MHS-2 TaxID=1280950 RepID=A0A059FJQ1_9PROT|nr:hypothetical protein [Hyphomonas johnsonii]KCZ90859.1 TonB-dependent receptor [Hyphomonas johnsonii MHS-2]